MNTDVIAAFLFGAIFMESLILGFLIFEEFRMLRKLREIEARQAAGEWLPADMR
jgi:hypothetical protein